MPVSYVLRRRRRKSHGEAWSSVNQLLEAGRHQAVSSQDPLKGSQVLKRGVFLDGRLKGGRWGIRAARGRVGFGPRVAEL